MPLLVVMAHVHMGEFMTDDHGEIGVGAVNRKMPD